MKKRTHFVASSKNDLMAFPDDVRREVGFAIYLAESGDKAINALPLVGYGGANVLEIRSDEDGSTFRAVYTVRFSEAVYVLHASKKKAKSGIATPLKDLRLIKSRLKLAEEHYEEHYEARTRERKSVGKQE